MWMKIHFAFKKRSVVGFDYLWSCTQYGSAKIYLQHSKETNDPPKTESVLAAIPITCAKPLKGHYQCNARVKKDKIRGLTEAFCRSTQCL
ncbi:hypothetical protein GDO78_015604 [Eleutherodactylus coqui]|uniref:Uncharacterized protein n=1 Tax=Eleutherodactylus coqui TaxID=57060 RepID=A0A8J6JYP4_ELECQ|nr:hypothetical protein GDO78_015604 [Eleutherodactylus coqui]